MTGRVLELQFNLLNIENIKNSIEVRIEGVIELHLQFRKIKKPQK